MHTTIPGNYSPLPLILEERPEVRIIHTNRWDVSNYTFRIKCNPQCLSWDEMFQVFLYSLMALACPLMFLGGSIYGYIWVMHQKESETPYMVTTGMTLTVLSAIIGIVSLLAVSCIGWDAYRICRNNGQAAPIVLEP